MVIKNSVFGSDYERDFFYKLNERWGKKYAIFHNLPFLNIFEVKPNHPNFQFLKNTSVDYTFCDINDCNAKPLFCIEFDGMQNGFNIKNNYYARYPKDEQRKFRFEIKLNIANEEKFPFIIVGFEEFNDNVNSSLTIVDGIIGIITANQKLMKLKEDFNPDILGYSSEDFNDYDYETQAFIRYEWLNLIRLQSSFDNNPILQRCNELSLNYSKYIDSYSVIYIDHNDKKEICLEWMFDYVENAKYIDAKCVIKLLNSKEICKTVSLANIKTSSCRVYCLPDKFRYFHDYCDETAARDCCLVSNIARLLAFEELEKYISAADA